MDWPAENKNLSEVKCYSKGYLFWYQDFDRFRQVVVRCPMPISMICKFAGSEIFKDTFLTVHLGTAAAEIRRVSLPIENLFFCFFG